MKRLAFLHLYHAPPKSAAAAAFTPTSTISASLNSYQLRFHAYRNEYSPNFIKKSLVHASSYPHQMAATTTSGESTAVINLKPIEATEETFHEFGQVIEASPDGDLFGPRDAQLDLSRGIPRFYIMHIEDRPLRFSTITHHANVTQCLGSIGGHVWYLGVAKPSIVDPNEIKNLGAKVVNSPCGHLYVPPAVEDVCVFKISGPKFVKLHIGTWHAGPLFLEKSMDFYNLELSNTNEVDHTTHNFKNKNNVKFSINE